MALKSEKIDALSGAILTLKENIWRKKALSPHVGTSYPHLKKRHSVTFYDLEGVTPQTHDVHSKGHYKNQICTESRVNRRCYR